MIKQLLVVAAVATGIALTSSTASAADATPTRIMIVGDSVTQGAPGDYTWRYFAWRALQDANVDFVGRRSDVNDGSHAYADPNFDQDHAARWGMALGQMLYSPDAASPRINDLVASQHPDVVVEMLGINDFVWWGATSVSMQRMLTEFVAEARSVDPNIDFVLGSLPQEVNPQVAAFNVALPAFAASLSTPTSTVVSTTYPDWVWQEDAPAIHPTTSGMQKLASGVLTALHRLGIGTGSPNTPVVVTPPVPAVDPVAPAAGPSKAAPRCPKGHRRPHHGRPHSR